MIYFGFVEVIFLLFLLQGTIERKFLYFLVFLLSFCFAGFSFKNGWDANSYIGWFQLIEHSGFDGVVGLTKYVEPGFVFLMFIFTVIKAPYALFIIVFSLVTNIFYYKFCKEFKVNYIAFILLFFVTTYTRLELSTLRQGIAVALFVYSLKFVLNQKFLQYMVICIIAGFFHRTAFLLILIYPVLILNLNARKHYVCIFLGLFILLLTPIFNIAELILMKVQMFAGGVVGAVLFQKLNFYLQESISIFNPQRLILLPFYLLFVFYRIRSNQYRILLNLLLLQFILNFYLAFLPNVILLRFEYYFIFGWIGLFCLQVNRLLNKSVMQQTAVTFALLIFLNFKLMLLFKSEADQKVYFPYRSSLEIPFYNMDDVRSEDEIESISNNAK